MNDIPPLLTEAIEAQILHYLQRRPSFLFADPPPLTIEELEVKRAKKAMREADEAAFLAAIDAVDAPLARKVLDLHAREGKFYRGCTGCDAGSYAEDIPSWPCSTVALVADECGVKVPAHWR